MPKIEREISGNNLTKEKKSSQDISTKNGKLIMWIVVISMVGIITIPALYNYATSGSIFGGLPDVDNPELYIGYGKISLYAENSTGDYENVNGTIIFYNYYTAEIVGNGSADGTMYHFTNVTVGYVIWVNSSEALSYPNKSFLIFTNTTEATGYDNKVYLNYIGEASDFESTFYKIAKEDGTSAVYGNLGIADITTFNEKNFSMNLQIVNNGNGTFGENCFIPEADRFNESVIQTGLWIKFNIVLNYVEMNQSPQTIYYDDLGNSYFYLPTLNYHNEQDITLTLECENLPTQIQIIQGQWDGLILKTFN